LQIAVDKFSTIITVQAAQGKRQALFHIANLRYGGRFAAVG